MTVEVTEERTVEDFEYGLELEDRQDSAGNAVARLKIVNKNGGSVGCPYVLTLKDDGDGLYVKRIQHVNRKFVDRDSRYRIRDTHAS